jgi:hypothetical protein
MGPVLVAHVLPSQGLPEGILALVRPREDGTLGMLYTNVATGQTYSGNTAGSDARYVQNSDGTVTATFTGHTGFVSFESDAGGESITQYTGRFVVTLDSLNTFNVLSVDATAGQAVDVCAAID